MLGEEGDADAMFGTETHEEWAATHLAKTHYAGQRVHGYSELGLLFHAYGNGLAVLGQPSALGCHVQRVEQGFNRDPPVETFDSRLSPSGALRGSQESNDLSANNCGRLS